MPGESDQQADIERLFARLKEAAPEMRKLDEECGGHWGYEDPIYRFYHQSFKVYSLQDMTRRIVAALQSLAPDRTLNDWFMQIVRDGTGRRFAPEHNRRWLEETRPIVEAFFHARYFLEMAVRYGEKGGSAPRPLPSGWAALLELYGLR